MKSRKAQTFWRRPIGLVLLFLACGLTQSGREPCFASAHELTLEPKHQVRIGVLGLFHPKQFKLTSLDSALSLRAGDQSLVLEKSSGFDSADIVISGNSILVNAGARTLRGSRLVVSGRTGESTDFSLSILGKITRRYRGTLEIQPSSGDLIAVLTLDLETAVASVLASETDSQTPLEALKAQAIASRSYFIAARGRHHEFDFCDTTHCQFLREPPPANSKTTQAVEATRGLILAYNSQPFPAMYTRSCSGQTHTPAQLGLPSAAYPYFSVECAYCRTHPSRWTTRISVRDAAALQKWNEPARLELVRRIGWRTVPSNDFVIQRHEGEVVLEGTGLGHGIGLCQTGAMAMARAGASYNEILSHYYPNTSIMDLGL